MRGRKGMLIVVCGIDGSGKGTQWKELKKRFREEGYKVKGFDFPQYGKESARDVEKYLNGEFGPKELIDPKVVSDYYAQDRFSVAPEIQKHLDEGWIVLCNRYSSSNGGHQSIRYETYDERIEYLNWLFQYEYGELGIPKPDLTFITDVNHQLAQENVKKKGARDYVGGEKMDIHESDPMHLLGARDVYQWLANRYDDWHLINCMHSGAMRSVEDIHAEI